jgi:methyl-accepting chemotaxis protein
MKWNLSLTKKLYALISIPVACFMLFAGVQIYTRYLLYADGTNMDLNVDFYEHVSDVIQEIQTERGLSSLFLGNKISQSDLDEHRKKVDALIALYNENYSTFLKNSDLPDKAKAAIHFLDKVRQDVQQKAPAPDVIKGYSSGLDGLVLLEVSISNDMSFEGFETRLLSLILLESAKENMGKFRANLTSILASNSVLTNERISFLESLKAGFVINLFSPALILSPEGQKQLKDIEQSPEWKSVLTTYGVVLEKAQTGEYNQDSKEFYQKITACMDKTKALLSSEIAIINDTIRQSKLSHQKWFFGVSALVTMLVLFLGFFVWFFTQRLNQSLVEVATSVSHSKDQLSLAANEVASASENLSRTSVGQASALQETAASVEEIRSMVQKTADNTQKSKDISDASQKIVTQGSELMSDVRVSLIELGQANQQIFKQVQDGNEEIKQITGIINEIETKTKVINDIVFQTKLLSFNASVEAARAGEHGKGFAVVAEEVGNLATMSGTAAKEISEILSKSTSTVYEILERSQKKLDEILSQGKKYLEHTEEVSVNCEAAFIEISKKTRELGELINEIAMASDEQANGVAQIATALSDSDKMSQENSALSQQTAHSSVELKNLTSVLENNVVNLVQIVHGENKAA